MLPRRLRHRRQAHPPGDLSGAAKVTCDGAIIEVLFRNKGLVGGHITVERAGRAVVKRPLATRIDDNYLRWKDHRDYDKWTTDPHRRSVVLGSAPRGR